MGLRVGWGVDPRTASGLWCLCVWEGLLMLHFTDMHTGETDKGRERDGGELVTQRTIDNYPVPRLLGRILAIYHWGKPTWPFHFSATLTPPHSGAQRPQLRKMKTG